MSGIEGIGEAVSGAMVARAVEPAAGESAVEREGVCLNCGAELAGPYCSQCGQSAHVHRTLVAVWHDLAHGVLHLEGKIWRTLPLLAWKPGELTRRYVAGERAKFVSPIAIFLFSVFMMFAVFSFIGGPFSSPEDAHGTEARSGEININVQTPQAALDRMRNELADLRRQREAAAAAGRSTTQLDARIRESEADLRETEEAIGRVANMVTGAPAQEAEPRRSNRLRSDIPFLDAAFRQASANPELMIYKIETNAYKFSWMLIPISVPFVWLLFLHRRRYWRYKAYDHTVFVTYSLAFMSLGLVALSLMRQIGLSGTMVGLAILIVPPIHMFRQLRGAYELSVFSTLWRTIALLFVAIIASSIFFSLMMTLGAMH